MSRSTRSSAAKPARGRNIGFERFVWYGTEFVFGTSVGWPAATDVIGVSLGSEAKAYPVSFLGGRELVVDEIDNIPILVSW